MGMFFLLITTHKIDLVIVDVNGNPFLDSRSIEMAFYKVDWRWWWDNYDGEYANYFNTSYNKPIKSEKIVTLNGKAQWKIKVNSPDWGRYLVLAHDKVSGHTTGQFIYINSPGWESRMQTSNTEGATMLSLKADKTEYKVGEKVEISIPSSPLGKALVCLENGSKVIDKFWVESINSNTKISFVVSEEMTPNIYVHVALLQPHSQLVNDLPIRMYGILPITVIDDNTHLEPIISMPDVLKSEESVEIKVSEKNKRAMTYTLAIVDEGLLDLTRFITPDPWGHFYAKEALGVKTWDVFDLVIGAFGGKIERLLSIGGDGELNRNGNKKANRFKPLVKFIGPIELNAGKTNSHKIKLPQYVGSVRVMVIGGTGKAYGSTEKACQVRKPLMLLATLPRVLGLARASNCP
jgi:alpha-2-macroglobulin